MQSKHFFRAAISAVLLVIGFIVFWEHHWTTRGYTISYNDDKVGWAAKRKEANDPARRSTVFLGSSRIKFDLDIASWQTLTGERAVQLAKDEPRQKYWERLLNYTGCAGYHFADYPETSIFKCPDESHLSPTDAIKYTTHLVDLFRKKGWFY